MAIQLAQKVVSLREKHLSLYNELENLIKSKMNENKTNELVDDSESCLLHNPFANGNFEEQIPFKKFILQDDEIKIVLTDNDDESEPVELTEFGLPMLMTCFELFLPKNPIIKIKDSSLKVEKLFSKMMSLKMKFMKMMLN